MTGTCARVAPKKARCASQAKVTQTASPVEGKVNYAPLLDDRCSACRVRNCGVRIDDFIATWKWHKAADDG